MNGTYRICSGVDVYVTAAIGYGGDERTAVIHVLKANHRAEP